MIRATLLILGIVTALAGLAYTALAFFGAGMSDNVQAGNDAITHALWIGGGGIAVGLAMIGGAVALGRRA